MDDFVAVEGLVKDYRSGDRAVDGLSFSVRSGEVYGLLGRNGAGKTTTVRLLVGLLAPTAGSAVVGGQDVRREAEAVRRLVGYTAQGSGLDIDLTVAENLRLRAALHGLDRARARSRAGAVMARLGLETLADRRAGHLSGGQRRRPDLATALVHKPRLLVLDEPTTGLDPQARRALWEEIGGLAEAGTTVLLTTQYMEEADRLCDRVGIIDGGQLIAEGSPAALRAATGDEVITVDLVGSVDAERLRRRFGRLQGLGEVVVASNTVSVASADPAETVPAILHELRRARFAVAGLRVGPPSLEDVYLRYTGPAMTPGHTQRETASSFGVVIGAAGGSDR